MKDQAFLSVGEGAARTMGKRFFVSLHCCVWVSHPG